MSASEVRQNPDAERMFRALRSLKSRQRDVLLLARCEMWTYARIGAHLAITTEQVEKELAAALLALSNALNEGGGK